MKILTFDIETSPIVGYTWGTWNTNVVKIKEPPRVMCFAAKWLDDSKVLFRSEFEDGADDMVAYAWSLLSQADAVIHFNGARFDVPHLNREFLMRGMIPPTSYKQIDLLRTARKQFKFPSNKLDYLTQVLGIDGKFKHSGFSLWERCLDGDPKAWAEMKKYNKQDVRATEALYYTLLPWIQGHPNRRLYDGGEGCPTCGGENLQRRGYAYTNLSKFQRFQCLSCGSYFRGNKRIEGVTMQEEIR